MNLFRALLTASLKANLTQSEQKLFMVLLVETLDCGKASAFLSLRTLVGLTGLRIDHLKIAIAGLVKKEMFEVEQSVDDEYCYSIPRRFLD
jgi:hypothetical protein